MKKENDNKALDDLLSKLEVKPHREDLASSIINKAAQIKQQKSFIYYLQDVIEGLSNNFYLPSPRFSMAMFILVGFLSGVIASDLSIESEQLSIFDDNFTTEVFFDEDFSL